MITLKALEDAGYQRYKSTLSSYAEFLMQKRVENLNGTKYFISVEVYAAYPNQEPGTLNFQVEVQFTDNYRDRKDPFHKPTINVTYFDDDNTILQDVEDFYERMWVHLGEPYYDRDNF